MRPSCAESNGPSSGRSWRGLAAENSNFPYSRRESFRQHRHPSKVWWSQAVAASEGCCIRSLPDTVFKCVAASLNPSSQPRSPSAVGFRRPPRPRRTRLRCQQWTRNRLMTGRKAGKIGCPLSQRFWLVAPGLPSISSCSSQPHAPTSTNQRRTDRICFSLFLQREGAEDILDFWLDVQQHENLCRAYFKDIRKSGRAIKEDWPEYWEYARRRGSIYGTVVGLGPPTGTKRSTTSTNELLTEQDRQNLAAIDEKAMRSPSPRMTSATPATVTGDDYFQQQPRSSTPFSLSGRTPTLFNKRVSRAPTVIPRSAAVTRHDLIASAEHIYYRYLSPAGNTVGATENHEIYLPPSLRIHTFPLTSGQDPKSDAEKSLLAQVPDMFHTQKEYCFRAMEQDAFPRFLRSKAFGNLTPLTALVRLIAGLIILWIGLAAGFSLIFLDVQPKSKRFFVSLPLPLPPTLSLMSISYSFHSRSRFSCSSHTSMNWIQSSSSSVNRNPPPSVPLLSANPTSRNYYSDGQFGLLSWSPPCPLA